MTNPVSPGATATGTGTESAAAPAAATPARRSDGSSADVIIALALFVVFAAAFVTALQWQAVAGLFPLIATGVGVALSAAFSVSTLVRRGRERRAEPEPAPGPRQATEATGDADDSEDADDTTADQSEADHMFFASLNREDWAVSLGYLAAFFVGLYVCGLYVAAAVFTVLYLRFQAKSSWLFSGVYAAVLVAAVYGLFGLVLKLPLPEGLLGLTFRP
ncbi:tripartite tricarboxylate transporter TctB family protein [Streptomyces sp. NPDC059909]|uniref:tripartite tricarboxylate transporter TctB family protein n=1 Tax=Streptomyces sp. NPDC059909 TaxID=3346998 RepID=UPI00364CC576